ncbi:hypothetical protein CBR_g41755 [Chara braunii]|uniref:Protein kinase domain-containing protein n=1 Tax=Chara braunii TaxID=69332 RepID=A0A388LWU7_CHABU|nr:hypothetical protein CBR_g41755 [Chara braunii]|eukprot:GBG86692.1 hypothetical protein CBR_g41755 [Chara braunii]
MGHHRRVMTDMECPDGQGELRLTARFRESNLGDCWLDIDVHPSKPWFLFIRSQRTLQIWNYKDGTLKVKLNHSGGGSRYLAAKFVGKNDWVAVSHFTGWGYNIIIYQIVRIKAQNLDSDMWAVNKVKYVQVEKKSSRSSQLHVNPLSSYPLAVSPSSRYILTTGKSSIYMLDLHQSCTEPIFIDKCGITQLSFHPRQLHIFAAGGCSGEIRLFDSGQRSALQTAQAGKVFITSLQFDGDRQKTLLIAGNNRDKVQIWDYKSKACVVVLERSVRAAKCCNALALFHPQWPYVLSASEDGTLWIWNKSNYKLLLSFHTGVRKLRSMAVCRNSNELLLGGEGAFLVVEADQLMLRPEKKIKTGEGDVYGRNNADKQITTPESKEAVRDQKAEKKEAERVLQPPLEVEPSNVAVVGMDAARERSDRSGPGPEHFERRDAGSILRFESDLFDHRMEEAAATDDGICLHSELANTVNKLESDANTWMDNMLMLGDRSKRSGSDNAKEERRDGGTVKLCATQASNVMVGEREVLEEISLVSSGSENDETNKRMCANEVCNLEAALHHTPSKENVSKLVRKNFKRSPPELHQENKRMQMQEDTLTADHPVKDKEVVTDKISDLKAGREVLEAKSERYGRDYDDRASHDAERIKELEKEVSDLMAEKAELNERFERSASEHDKNEQTHAEKIRQLESEVSNLVAEREALRERSEQCGSDPRERERVNANSIDRLDAERSEERSEKSVFRIQELDKEVASLTAERSALTQRVERLTVKVHELGRRLQSECNARQRLEKCAELRQAGNQEKKEGDDRFPLEFSFTELQAATGNFNDSCKVQERSYGVVYEGKITPVLIKTFKAGEKMWSQDAKSTREMIQKLKSLRHPNLQTLLGVCYEGNCLLVYEHMANGSLKDRISCAAQGPMKGGGGFLVLSWHVRLWVLAEVAEALFFLHSTQLVDGGGPVIHRAINPENIFLDNKLSAKIGEVDAALLAPSKASRRCLSPDANMQYLAPESCRSRVFDEKTDIYSFGITMLETLTGNFQDAVGTIENAVKDASVFPSALDAKAGVWDVDLALQVAQLGLRCANLDRSNRPSMADGEGAILPTLNAIASKVKLAISQR